MIQIKGHKTRAIKYGDKDIIAVYLGDDTSVDLLRYIIVEYQSILLNNDYLAQNDNIISNTTWKIII